MRKYVLISILLIAGLFITIFILFCRPTNINIEYPAVKYRANDNVHTENIKIKIQGKIYKNIFSNPTYIGKINIENYDFTKQYQLLPIIFDRKIMNGMGSMTYTTVINGSPKVELLGTIWISDNFKTVHILINEPIGKDEKTVGDLIISAPAQTHKDAIKISETFNYKKNQ